MKDEVWDEKKPDPQMAIIAERATIGQPWQTAAASTSNVWVNPVSGYSVVSGTTSPSTYVSALDIQPKGKK